MIVELLLPTWSFAVPETWSDFEVKCAPADDAFSNFAGSKITVLKGTQLSSANAQAVTMFNSMIKAQMAIEPAPVKPITPALAKSKDTTKGQ